MCCLFTVLVFLGPRFGVLLWWLAEPLRFQATFGGNWVLPLLCFAFLPWTLLMYLVVAPFAGLTPGTDIQGFDWILLGLAVFTDILSYTGGAFGNRQQVYAYVPAAADPSFSPPSTPLPPPGVPSVSPMPSSPPVAPPVETAPLPDDFKRLEGVGSSVASALNGLGITTYAQLAEYDPRQLETDLTAAGAKVIPGSLISVPAQAALAAAGRWNAVKYIQDEVLKGGRLALPDVLTKINGIGPGVATKLDEMGITTYRQLRDADPDQLESDLKASGLRLPKGSVAWWHEQAALAADSRWEDLKTLQSQQMGEAGADDGSSAGTEATGNG